MASGSSSTLNLLQSLLYPSHRPFHPPSLLELLLTSPLKTLLGHLYRILLHLRGPSYTPPPHAQPIRIVCISDTHTHHPAVPDGDLLIHAGDLTDSGTVASIAEQITWLRSLPHPRKVVICGNHDSFFDPRSRRPEDEDVDVDEASSAFNWDGIHYLQHSGVTLTFPNHHHHRTLHVYGAPQIPWLDGKEHAFKHPRNADAWTGTVPLETDVLVTHTPAKWHLDLADGLGDAKLLGECWRVRPTLHVCGHVHAGYGRESVWWDEAQRYYERAMGRECRGVLGQALSPGLWVDGTLCVWYAAMGVVWRRVWGGAGNGGIVVNAALVHHQNGKIVNDAHIVEL